MGICNSNSAVKSSKGIDPAISQKAQRDYERIKRERDDLKRRNLESYRASKLKEKDQVIPLGYLKAPCNQPGYNKNYPQTLTKDQEERAKKLKKQGFKQDVRLPSSRDNFGFNPQNHSLKKMNGPRPQNLMASCFVPNFGGYRIGNDPLPAVPEYKGPKPQGISFPIGPDDNKGIRIDKKVDFDAINKRIDLEEKQKKFEEEKKKLEENKKKLEEKEEKFNIDEDMNPNPVKKEGIDNVSNKILDDSTAKRNELSFGLLSAAMLSNKDNKIEREDIIDDFNLESLRMIEEEEKEIKEEKEEENEIKENNLEPEKEVKIKQNKLASAWSHPYRPPQTDNDTYKFGSNLEGITADYWGVVSKIEGGNDKYVDKNFPATWDSIRGNGNKDDRM